MAKKTQTTTAKKDMKCSKCGKDDFYNTIAGPACWECDTLYKEEKEPKA